MSDIQSILNNFAEAVGAQIKALSQRVDDDMRALRESIGAMDGVLKSLEERQPSTEEVADMVRESVEVAQSGLIERVDKCLADIVIPQPEKATPGTDGKDATQIEVLPCIDPAKSYPRGTHALHNGGTWRAYQKTVGMTGWECVMNGVAGVDVTIEGKTLRIVSTLSDGTKSEATKTIPFPEYKGVYIPGEAYEKGDSATHDGAVWIALEDAPKDAPGSGKGWQLAVKRGRDGRGLYAIARAAGFTGTEKELLPFILKGEAPNNVVRLKDGIS